MACGDACAKRRHDTDHFGDGARHGSCFLGADTGGEPLRAVLPVTAAAGETIVADCIALVPPGDGSGAPLVTAKVSLERAAAGPQLVITTPQGLNEPVLRLAIRAGCEAQTRRDYLLLLDPPAASRRTTDHAAATKANAPAVRGPGQEPSAAAAATSAAARRRELTLEAPHVGRCATRYAGTLRDRQRTPRAAAGRGGICSCRVALRNAR